LFGHRAKADYIFRLQLQAKEMFNTGSMYDCSIVQLMFVLVVQKLSVVTTDGYLPTRALNMNFFAPLYWSADIGLHVNEAVLDVLAENHKIMLKDDRYDSCFSYTGFDSFLDALSAVQIENVFHK
jgi:hypothetical protein